MSNDDLFSNLKIVADRFISMLHVISKDLSDFGF